MDLSNAIDTLDHTILLNIFEYYSVKGVALSLTRNYLTGRKQYVEIYDAKSDMLNISTIVPQSSILLF